MTDADFLLWARGPAFTWATAIMFAGIAIRFMEILLLGRKKDLAEARGSAAGGGMSTMFRRSIPDADSFHRSGFTIISGYVFHIGLAIVILFFVPHILLFEDITGLSWPGLPSNIIDSISVVTIIALLAVLAHRIMNPVMRMLSGFSDYLVWFITLLPLVTGYLAFHRIGLSASTMLALHILSVELLMVLIPFTKLSHMFTLWMARWYNGAIAGYKGVRS